MILSVNQIYSGYLQNLGIGAYMLNSLMHGSDSAEFYHKTEYFLRQVQTTPVEFSVHMSGLKTIASQLMKSVSQNTEIHTQLRELIEKLEIAPRENAKLNLGAWIRLVMTSTLLLSLTRSVNNSVPVFGDLKFGLLSGHAF